jgi:hypothetical protein
VEQEADMVTQSNSLFVLLLQEWPPDVDDDDDIRFFTPVFTMAIKRCDMHQLLNMTP